MFFLVGYFYFGGFELIAEKLDEKEMKILIGLDAEKRIKNTVSAVSYTHLRAHETVPEIVCRLLLEKKKQFQALTTVDS